MRSRDGIIERPQHMDARGHRFHGDDEAACTKTCHCSSTCTRHPRFSTPGQRRNIFVFSAADKGYRGISTRSSAALVSQSTLGLSTHDVRSSSHIKGTNGSSNGIVPMLQIFNACSRYVDQGGGKRKGSIAIYLEPWHSDVLEFLDLKKNHGKEESRARDLFYGLWTSDLFMRRVKANEDWSLFCPNECPGLSECHGDEFTALYERYEAEGRAKKIIRAQKLWYSIVEAQ